MSKHKIWINWCFDTNYGFRSSSCVVEYDGFDMEIRIDEYPYAPNIFVETTSSKRDKAYEAVLGFLSELSWLFQTKVELLHSWIESSEKTGGHKQPSWIRKDIVEHIDLVAYSQICSEDIQKLALGLYREGITSNSVFYSFLSYFKIITIKYPHQKQVVKWINDNIENIHGRPDLINHLQNNKVGDIGQYLYSSGRCALAHADWQRKMRGEEVVNPNNYTDNMRIGKELPLIKELAEISIKNELSIPDYFEALKEWKAEIRDKILRRK